MTSLQCAGCAHANELGARFCAQCGTSLAPRCSSCGAELPAAARFCSSCGAAVAADPVAVADGALKVVSVVFSDLVGSTALQEALDTESVRRVMTRFYEAMRAVVERHEGALQKFIGDAVVVVFGAPAVREDDALRAVRCAVDMVAALDQLNAELEPTFGVRLHVRTGVNTGELVVNDEGIFVGDTMNTAARFEQAAGGGEVLIGEATRRLVRHQAELEQIEPLALKGKSEPVPAWRVLSVAAGPAQRLEAPLVGRASELGRLRSALDDAVTSRRCRLVTVVGSPGLGKSRLAQEFAAAVAEQATVVAGHCEPSGEGITFLPVADVIRGVAGIAESDPPEAVVEKLSALLAVDGDRDRIVARAASLVGAGEPASPEETFWSVRRLLEAVAHRGPLVVVLDDVHWGQPLFLDLIEHLVEWVRDAPLLLVALARPELREMREALTSAGRRASEVIELDPLDSGESRELVEGILGRVDLPAPLLERILETTDGNPLFLGELLRMLVDEGALVRTGDAWVAARGADAVQVPPTIQALLTARIERLQPHERSVVERASVIGKQFYRGAVAELVAPPVRSGIDGHLETLRRKDMVEPEGTYWIDEPVYRFHHVLIRDAAYRLLLKEARAELHERFADWLATKAGELVGEHEEVIAYHLEQAHEYRRQLGPLDDRGRALGERAATLLASAGRRALAREDLAAAANLLQRSIDRGSADPDALWNLAEALLSAGETGAAATVVKQVRGPRGVVLGAQLAVLTGAGSLDTLLTDAIAATAALAEAGDGVGEAKAHHVVAQLQAQLGQVAAVESALDRALLAARRAEDRRRITAVLAAAPRAALWGPSPVVRASGRCLDVVRILRMTPGNRHVEAVALRCQAVLEAMRGRADAAREILRAGRATLEELGLTLELCELTVHAGIVELLAGEAAAASELLATARDGFEALGVAVSAAQAAALLGRAQVELGNDREAIASTEYAEAHAGGDLKTTITWLGVRGEALARRGAFDAALALARRAVELAEPTDALPDKADAKMALARVLQATGRQAEAADVVEAARELYVEKDHAVGIARAGEPIVATQSPTPVQGTRIEDPELDEFFKRYAELWRSRDADGLLALRDPEFKLVDHRQLGRSELPSLEAIDDTVLAAVLMSHDPRFHVDQVIACERGVIAMKATLRGQGSETDGELEIPLGAVLAFRDGRIRRQDLFEPVDEAAIRACFAEQRGLTLLGDKPPERWWSRFVERFREHDRAGLAEMWSPDMVLVDHRAVGWEEMHGLDSMLELADSAWGMAPDIRASIDEVLACDECVIALRLTYVGSAADGGGPIELPVGYVSVFAADIGRRGEMFDADDRDGMLARYTELGGTREAVLGDSPAEQAWAGLAQAFADRELDRLLDRYTDDFVLLDHRQLPWEDVTDRRGLAELLSSGLGVAPDLRVVIDEVICRDEHVMAVRLTWHGSAADGGGILENPYAHVFTVRDGRIARIEMFDPDAETSIRACFAEQTGLNRLGAQPPEQWYASWVEHYARHDRAALAELWADDVLFVDHRALAWEEVRGRQPLLSLIESTWEVVPDNRCAVDEVLACDECTMAVRSTYRGTAADGGGPTEIAFGHVYVIERGICVRNEQFDHDDRAGMLARYVELGGGLSRLGDQPPEQLVARLERSQVRHDLDALLELFSPGVTFVDHRSLAWDQAHGVDDIRHFFASAFAMFPVYWVEVDEVLACDERVIAMRTTTRGFDAAGAGRFEISFGAVLACEDGRIISWDQYEAGDRAAILARFAELTQSGSSLPPMLVLAEFIRRLNAHDPAGIAALGIEDGQMTDHRRYGLATLRGREQVAASYAAIFGMWPDLRFELDEVLACDPQVVAFRGTYHGTATEGGGPGTTPIGCCFLVEDGAVVSIDVYEPEDRQAMIARYAELGGGLGKLGATAPERWWHRYAQLYAARDRDAVAAMHGDGTLADHRQLGWESASTAEEAMAIIDAAWAATTDIRIDVEEVLASDERACALRITWRGTEATYGAAWEIPMGVLFVIEDGRSTVYEMFEPDGREAMLARYAELGGGRSGELGERPPERVLARRTDVWRRHDGPGLAATLAADLVLTDHRPMGWERHEGRAAAVELVESSWRLWAADQQMTVEQVLACDEHVIAARVVYRGTAHEGGGQLEMALGQVERVVDGLVTTMDFYEPDDRQAMIARYAELGGGQRPLGGRPPERLFAEYVRRHPTRVPDCVAALFSEDWVLNDHRGLGWATAHGRLGAAELLRSGWAVSADIHIEVDEVLASDERVLAVRYRWVGSDEHGGAMEVPVGVVMVFTAGLCLSYDQYDAADTEAILARFAELAGASSVLGGKPPARVFAEHVERFNRRDVDADLELIAEDFRYVDHRPISLGSTLGREAHRDTLCSIFEVAPDARTEVEAVLACDDRVMAVRVRYHGHSVDGSGEFELVTAYVLVIEDDLWTSVDQYDPDDREALLARYIQLGGGQGPLGDTPPERFMAAFLRCYGPHDLDALAALHAEDVVFVDHRHLGWEDIKGRAAARAFHESVHAMSPDFWGEIDNVLACDDRVIACTSTWRGLGGADGGAHETKLGQVVVVEDGVCVTFDQYQADAIAAMLARYAELGGGQAALGGRPPERWWAAVLRAYARGHVDALVELYSDGWTFSDHRLLGWETMSGHADVGEFWRSALAASSAQYGEVEEVLACDDRVIAIRVAWRGIDAEHGGEFVIPVGDVTVVESGRCTSQEHHDPADHPAMLATFTELTAPGPGPETRPGRLPEVIARSDEAFSRQDREALAATYAPEIVWLDRRGISGEDYQGREAVLDLAATVWRRMLPDVGGTTDEVLAGDGHIVARLQAYRGTAQDGGGELELLVGQVIVIEDGLIARIEFFDADDRRAMIARCAELGGGARPAGDPPAVLRWMHSYLRAWNAHHLDAVVAHLAEDYVHHDRRRLGLWGEVQGRDAWREQIRPSFSASSDARLESVDVVAHDERVAACIWSFKGTWRGGPYESTMAMLLTVEDGLLTRSEFLDPDDPQAMIARYAELGGGLGALGGTRSERTFGEYARRYAARDLDGLLALCSEDWRLIDHRQIGWGEMDRERYAAEMPTVWTAAADVRVEVDEVIAADDRVFAGICTYRGTAARAAGGGPFEYSVGMVSCNEAGVGVTDDWYEPGDRDAILARFTDFSNAARQFDELRPYHRFDRLFNERRMDELPGLYTEDFVLIDRRQLAWEEIDGGDAFVAQLKDSLEQHPHERSMCEPLIDDGGDLILYRLTFGSEGAAAGPYGAWEWAMTHVMLLRDGLVQRIEMFDEQEAARARYDELRADRAATPGARAAFEFDRLFNAKRFDELTGLYTEDFAMLDHRQLGWEERRGQAVMIEQIRSTVATSPEERSHCEPIADDGGEVVIYRDTFSGKGHEGVGPWELVLDLVIVVRDGRVARIESFDPADEQARTARFEQLRDHRPAG